MSKNLKKWMGLLLTVILLTGSLAACSKDKDTSADNTQPTKAAQPTEAAQDQADTPDEAATEAPTQEADDGLDKATVIHVGWQGASSVRNINAAKGFFEEEFGKDGITVEFEQFTYGPPIIEALSAGSLDFGEVGDMPVVTGKANGIEITSVYKSGVDPDSNVLLVPADSEDKSIEDLKGKKIGTSIGSSAHHYLALLLGNAGLALEDVEIVNLGATDIKAALVAGEIDAATTWEPYGAIITGDGSGKYIAKSSGVKQNTATIVASNKFIENNPDITARYLKVVLKIEQFIQSDREAAIDIIAEQSGFNVSDLAAIYRVEYNPYFTDYDWDQMEKTKEFLLDNDLIENDFDIKTIYTDKYLIEAEKLFNEAN